MDLPRLSQPRMNQLTMRLCFALSCAWLRPAVALLPQALLGRGPGAISGAINYGWVLQGDGCCEAMGTAM